jgi:hypothetical protein
LADLVSREAAADEIARLVGALDAGAARRDP